MSLRKGNELKWAGIIGNGKKGGVMWTCVGL
jgi:hypothetical protein